MIEVMIAAIGMMLILGLAVLCACVLMPREIGKEDLPLSSVRLPRPDLEGLGLKLNRPRRPAAPRPAYQRPTIVPPPPEAVDGPSAMGAPQPVLTQAESGLMALQGQ